MSGIGIGATGLPGNKSKKFTLQDVVEDLERRDSLEGVFNYKIGDEVAIIPDAEKLERIVDTYVLTNPIEKIHESLTNILSIVNENRRELFTKKIVDAAEKNIKFDESFIKELNSVLGFELEEVVVKRLHVAFKFFKQAYELFKLFSEDVVSGKEILKGEVIDIKETTLNVKFNEFVTLELRYLDVYKHVSIELNLDDL